MAVCVAAIVVSFRSIDFTSKSPVRTHLLPYHLWQSAHRQVSLAKSPVDCEFSIESSIPAYKDIVGVDRVDRISASRPFTKDSA